MCSFSATIISTITTQIKKGENRMDAKNIILIALLIFIFNSEAAVTVKVVVEDGNEKLIASKPLQVAKNCGNEIRDLIIKRANWHNTGEFERLTELYIDNAVINHSTLFFNKKQKRESYLISKYIEKLSKSRSQQNKYLYLQLNGECKEKDGYVIYTGMEVEKLDFEEFKPLIASSVLKIIIDNKTNKIKSEKQKIKIQTWEQGGLLDIIESEF
jgi:hypothetical protein